MKAGEITTDSSAFICIKRITKIDFRFREYLIKKEFGNKVNSSLRI